MQRHSSQVSHVDVGVKNINIGGDSKSLCRTKISLHAAWSPVLVQTVISLLPKYIQYIAGYPNTFKEVSPKRNVLLIRSLWKLSAHCSSCCHLAAINWGMQSCSPIPSQNDSCLSHLSDMVSWDLQRCVKMHNTVNLLWHIYQTPPCAESGPPGPVLSHHIPLWQPVLSPLVKIMDCQYQSETWACKP